MASFLPSLTNALIKASFTSGEPPSLLGRGKSEWWFEGDTHSYHRYSIEQLYGMSRGMIDMIARVCLLFPCPFYVSSFES